MAEEQREWLGICSLLHDIQEIINSDKELQEILGEKHTATYIDVAKEWNKQLDGMGEQTKGMAEL